MQELLIVGAGPAAVGAALAAVDDPDTRVTVIDVGGQLEEANDDARARLSRNRPEAWAIEDRTTVSRLPADSQVKGLPEKRAYGSDFPFRDFGQLVGLSATADVNDRLVSGAYGGFSNVWGAQVMPFRTSTFQAWPITADEMYSHYSRILEVIPYAAEADDLADQFPILGGNEPLPPLSDRSVAVLDRYAMHRERLKRRRIVVGRARLALESSACVRCGLCMTGCPYSLIYSASQTLDQLRRDARVEYYDGLLAVRVREDDRRSVVSAVELATGRLREFAADRVLLACGAIGTSRLVMGSLGLHDSTVQVAEATQFMLPFTSLKAVQDPSTANDFTLNQFNMAVGLDPDGADSSLLHFYTYNPAFVDALPAVLNVKPADALRQQLLRRLTVALGYLPSWAGPTFQMRTRAPRDPRQLPAAIISAGSPGFWRNSTLRAVLRRVSAAGPALDLWPVLPALRIAAGGKSYHWGATFPHSRHPRGRFSSDRLGRVQPWERTHLIDASVFPTIPATTFTLTLMANANRIAHAILKDA